MEAQTNGRTERRSGAQVNKKAAPVRSMRTEQELALTTPARSPWSASRLRAVQRNLDAHRRRRVATILTPMSTRMIVVANMGPLGVGKHADPLAGEKVHQYNVPAPVGPVTVVTGKSRRVTLLEVPNEPTSTLAAKTVNLCHQHRCILWL